MKTKKISTRTCVVSHEKLEKKDLVRIVKTKEGEVSIDLTGRANGRGAYLKKDKDVIEKARKTKALDRHLEIQIPEEIYDELLKLI